ncbi:MAG: malonyl-ACP O-methyltransferase BioC [Gammaproteobacteria bacterium]|nr:malonyl-ACP O-methyltransferase BioC [Gammaproteobacteria bacterium]
MPNDRTSLSGGFTVDKRQLRRAFDRAAPHYDEVAVLQREVGNRLLERLSLLRATPTQIADIGAGTGTLTAALARRYPSAQLLALDLAPQMLQLTRRRQPWRSRVLRRMHCICGDAEALPLATQRFDMLISSLTMQWCNDLDRTLQEFRRVLRPGGVLMFATFGPDTLRELRHCWSQVDGYNHVNAFIDMHDIGDALLRAGFAQPVTDMEYFTLTYPDLQALTRDLKTLGAHNVTAGRPRTLTGRHRWQHLAQAYEDLRRDGTLPVTYEVIYGHAWVPEHPAATPHGNEVQITVDRIGGRHGK